MALSSDVKIVVFNYGEIIFCRLVQVWLGACATFMLKSSISCDPSFVYFYIQVSFIEAVFRNRKV